ncbi:hypothetical protein CYMTET_24130 [Cymbomonas tetramitiformis]|uniref:Uncharacterized protein n=1 Tax=Cymbomonas tetramitiformis TaxID=36881 RepID=A0AAE0L0D6_9CHLO|nr:hypothetical protein CYMTET_24130 [Cymbomonas tetramitiformis]
MTHPTKAVAAAQALPSVRALKKQGPIKLGHLKGFRTCALVGNAGHLVKKKWGKYIDNHDLVVRFNTQELAKFQDHVGGKTGLRVLNHARSRQTCCPSEQGTRLPEKQSGKKIPAAFLLWHPGRQSEIKTACRKKFKGTTVFGLDQKFIGEEVGVMQGMRRDLMRLGMRGFGGWKQLTSGGHAILLLSRMCKYMSLYGFTTYKSAQKSPDQYGGRGRKSSSGKKWHDWGGESLAWRLLHASERATICSV